MNEPFLMKDLVSQALTEDLLSGDRTTEALFPDPITAIGEVIAKENLIVAGIDLFQMVFQSLDPKMSLEIRRSSGQRAKNGDLIARINGDGRNILKGERIALNFLQRLSGIATLTSQYVQQIQGTSASIVDTRKTTPGFRIFEREAVRLGGGRNHRFNLGDLILIKDNHIALAGGIGFAIKRTRRELPHPLKVEIEVKELNQIKEALSAEIDIIMLDNMSLEEIKKAVSMIRKTSPAPLIEVSGGVHLDCVASIAQCGVDLISVGALTHSARAVDISLNIRKATRS